MLSLEHSAILLTCIKRKPVMKTNFLVFLRVADLHKFYCMFTWLENSTRPLIFTSTSGCRASENFDISNENQFFSLYDAGQVPIIRYFEANKFCFLWYQFHIIKL